MKKTKSVSVAESVKKNKFCNWIIKKAGGYTVEEHLRLLSATQPIIVQRKEIETIRAALVIPPAMIGMTPPEEYVRENFMRRLTPAVFDFARLEETKTESGATVYRATVKVVKGD